MGTSSATFPRRAAARQQNSSSGGPTAPAVVCGAAIATDVIRRVVSSTLRLVQGTEGSRLEEIINETIYQEELRLSHAHADGRTKSDRRFMRSLRHDLSHGDEGTQRELVHRVVAHYVAEISGKFDPRVYGLATRALPVALDGLLRGLGRRAATVPHSWASPNLDDRIRVEGDADLLRKLAQKGTIVLAPSHVSHLDSVILGWVIHRLGLPPFAYGAGLNLFSNALVGFFLRNLGAYTIDRAKSDPLYRQTLKEYTTVLLEHGQHSLFFPGGTRSRSGAVEGKLKLGLLGTNPLAFRHGLEVGTRRPLFVVPCTLTYPLVLEASSLIDDFLRCEGRGRYVDRRDEFDRPDRWFAFLRGLAALDLVVHVRFGKPVDVVGNQVDALGESIDRRGRHIDTGDYFRDSGAFTEDGERDAEYTRIVAERLLEAYKTDTVALPTSLLAYAVFEHLRRDRAQPDLFRLLASIHPGASVPFDEVTASVTSLCEELQKLEAHGRIHLSDELRSPAAVVVRRALATFGTYHRRPVVALRGDRLSVSDVNLLFYYRNRLEGFGLLGAPSLLPSQRADARSR